MPTRVLLPDRLELDALRWSTGPEDEGDEEVMMMIYDEILQELVHEEQMMAAEDERQLELERQAEEAQFAVRL